MAMGAPACSQKEDPYFCRAALLLDQRVKGILPLCSDSDLKGGCVHWECVHSLTLTLTQLSKVVQSGGKNIELAVMRREQPLKVSEALVLLFSLPAVLVELC